MRNLVDLHVHSTASDGTLTPSEVVEHAYEKGLKAIALTDHDTVSGLQEAKKKAEQINALQKEQIEVVPGIEISCNYEHTELHILGYFVEENEPSFLEALETVRSNRTKRNEEILKKCQQNGFAITMEDLYEGNPKTVITRAHFASALQKKGYVKSKKQAFDKYLSPGGLLYLPKPIVTPKHALDMLAMAHAVPVLAHPFQYHLGEQGTLHCIQDLKEMGLKGVEAYHSSNSVYESTKLKEMAVHNGLFVTGGSDFHGENKPDIEIGCGYGRLSVHESLLEDVRMCKKHFS